MVVWIYGISIFVGYSMQNSFYTSIQFSLAWVHSLKTFLFQAIQFSQKVLIQAIQFSMSTQLNVKTVLFQAIQISISTQCSSISPIDRSL